MLKPQDIVVLLKILSTLSVAEGNVYDLLSQNKLAVVLCMSASEINAGIKRLLKAGLLSPVITNDPKNKITLLPNKAACEECLISGVKYFFPAKLGGISRGIVTGYAAPIIANQLILEDGPFPVWPYGEGDKIGVALEPLYSSVPKSVMQFPDSHFYEMLVLVDAIRSGRARERNIAIKLLKEKIHGKQFARTRFNQSENVGIRSKEVRKA